MLKYYDVEDVDNKRMTLARVDTGVIACEAIVCNGGWLQMAKIKGQWHSLNFKSQNPCNLPNKDTRESWAFITGIPLADVERYVRRIRDKCRQQALGNSIKEAKRLLESHGYSVEVKT